MAHEKTLEAMREAADVVATRTFLAYVEFFVGGIRFAPGRYIIKRVDDDGRDKPLGADDAEFGMSR